MFYSEVSDLKAMIVKPEENDNEDTGKVLSDIVEGMTGIEPTMDYTLEECGLASTGVPVLVNLLNRNFFNKMRLLKLEASDLVEAKTIGDMAEIIQSILSKEVLQNAQSSLNDTLEKGKILNNQTWSNCV